MSKLQLLTTNFENMKMMEDEIIVEFNVCLWNIANKIRVKVGLKTSFTIIASYMTARTLEKTISIMDRPNDTI